MSASSRPQHVQYLLIGAGIAGSSAAIAIRQLDSAGSVMLVGQEVLRPYHRPPLARGFLRGEIDREQLLSLPVAWFGQNNVQLVTGRRATWLEPDRHRATLGDGTVVQYEQCLLCFGAMVAPLELPGAGLPGLYYLRTLPDAEAILTRVQQALREGRPHPKGRGRVAVIGGGLLGLEVAASLRQRGLWVELVMDALLPWPGIAGDAMGRFLTSLLENQDIVVHACNPPRALVGDGRVQRVELAGGETVQCDFVIACVGLQVDRRLLQNTNIPMSRAVTCDEFGRSGIEQGVERIWAAGDCSAIFDARFGKHIHSGHASFAAATGRHVARNMVHAARNEALEAWNELPAWDSEIFGTGVLGWGLPRLIDRRIIRGSTNTDSPDFAEIGVDAAGRVCQVITVGRGGEQESLRRLVWDRADVTGREEDLRDPSRAIQAEPAGS